MRQPDEADLRRIGGRHRLRAGNAARRERRRGLYHPPSYRARLLSRARAISADDTDPPTSSRCISASTDAAFLA